MIEIKKILKKDVPKLLLDNTFWNFSFLTISKHRLLAHYKNPIIEENDIVLLLAMQTVIVATPIDLPTIILFSISTTLGLEDFKI